MLALTLRPIGPIPINLKKEKHVMTKQFDNDKNDMKN